MSVCVKYVGVTSGLRVWSSAVNFRLFVFILFAHFKIIVWPTVVLNKIATREQIE